MTFEAALISTVIALCGAIIFLFHLLTKRQDKAYSEMAKGLGQRLASGDQKLEDAVSRIRALEDARVIDERQHGHELKALASEVLREAAANRETYRQIADDNRHILRELIDAIHRWRKTGEPPSDDDLPEIETGTLIRKTL